MSESPGQLSLFDVELPLARSGDPATSKLAAKSLRRGSQRAKILAAYVSHGSMTDEEAGAATGIAGAWKRCSDLRSLGLIAPADVHAISSAGAEVMICTITEAGRRALR